MLKGIPKKYRTLKKLKMTLLEVIDLDNKLYMRKQICWAMSESGCGFRFGIYEKIKIKKKMKTQIVEYDGS